jgi:hypothetical protein
MSFDVYARTEFGQSNAALARQREIGLPCVPL